MSLQADNLVIVCLCVFVCLLQMYNFTSFAVSLNELEKGMEEILAPTDCRLRPDIRYMENGEMGRCEGWLAGNGAHMRFN